MHVTHFIPTNQQNMINENYRKQTCAARTLYPVSETALCYDSLVLQRPDVLSLTDQPCRSSLCSEQGLRSGSPLLDEQRNSRAKECGTRGKNAARQLLEARSSIKGGRRVMATGKQNTQQSCERYTHNHPKHTLPHHALHAPLSWTKGHYLVGEEKMTEVVTLGLKNNCVFVWMQIAWNKTKIVNRFSDVKNKAEVHQLGERLGVSDDFSFFVSSTISIQSEAFLLAQQTEPSNCKHVCFVTMSLFKQHSLVSLQ